MARARTEDPAATYTLSAPSPELPTLADVVTWLGIPKTTEAFAAFLADDARVRARLLMLPPHLAYVLHVLVAEARLLDEAQLTALIRARTPFDEPTIRVMLEAISLTGCAATVVIGGEGRAQRRGVALFREALPTLSRLLGGFDLVPPLRAEPVIQPPRVPRDAIVARAALAHRDVRITAAGRPNATSLKPIARALGLGLEALEAMIGEPTFEHDGGIIRVDLAWLERSAEPPPPIGPLLASCAVDELRAIEPIADAFERELADHLAFDARASSLTRERLRACARASYDTAEVEGKLYYRRPQPAPEAAPDGIVTPAFEIMLGEHASRRDVACLALAAVPQRIDHLVTLRLSPESVARAAQSGIDGPEILAALRRTSRVPVPENVAHAVLDWASRAPTSARVYSGTVVVLPEHDRPRAREALRALTNRELAPGVLLLRREATREALRACSRDAGVALEGVHALSAPSHGDGDEEAERAVLDRSLASLVASRLVLRSSVDPELRAAMEDAIVHARPITGLVPLDEEDPGDTPPMTLLEELIEELRALGAPRGLLDALGRLRERRVALDAEIQAIIRAIEPERSRPEAELLFEDFFPAFAYLLASDAPRARIRPHLRTIADLEALATLLPPSTVAPGACEEIALAFERHRIHQWLDRLEHVCAPDDDATTPPPAPAKRVRYEGPPIARDVLQKRARQAKSYGKPLTLVCQDGSGAVEREVLVLDIRERGDSFTLLAEDVDTGEARSIPAESVLDARR